MICFGWTLMIFHSISSPSQALTWPAKIPREGYNRFWNGFPSQQEWHDNRSLSRFLVCVCIYIYIYIYLSLFFVNQNIGIYLGVTDHVWGPNNILPINMSLQHTKMDGGGNFAQFKEPQKTLKIWNLSSPSRKPPLIPYLYQKQTAAPPGFEFSLPRPAPLFFVRTHA